MASQDINIIIKAIDNASATVNKVQNNMERVAVSAKKISQELRQTGRNISQIGSSMAMLGGAITAPFILALKQASEHSAKVREQTTALNNVWTNLQITLAEAVLPVFTKFVNFLADLVDRFMALDPKVKENIMQMVLLSGAALTLGGTFLMIAGKILSFVGTLGILASNLAILIAPHLAIVVVVGLIVGAMIKWHGVATAVMNALQLLVEVNYTVFYTIKTVIFEVLKFVTGSLVKFYDFLGKIPGKIGENYRKTAEGLQTLFQSTNILAKESWNSTIESATQSANTFKNLFTGTAGEWAQKWDNVGDIITNLKDQFANTVNYVKGIGDIWGASSGGNQESKKAPGNFFSGFMVGITKAKEELAKWAEFGEKVAGDLVNSMNSMFTSFFNDAFTGNLKSAKEYFAEFGKSILNMFSQMVSRMITQWIMFGSVMGQGGGGGGGGIFSSIMGLFGGGGGGASSAGAFSSGGTSWSGLGVNSGSLFGGFHKGGVVKAHKGAGIRSDEVPILAQTGEGILSRSGMENLGKLNRGEKAGGGVAINIQPMMQLWDVSDIHRNRKALTDIISQAIMGNSQIRKVMKEYA